MTVKGQAILYGKCAVPSRITKPIQIQVRLFMELKMPE